MADQVWSRGAAAESSSPAAGLAVLVSHPGAARRRRGSRACRWRTASPFAWVRPEQRTTASGLISIGGALGVIIGGPVPCAGVIAAAGWRWAFGLLGALGLVWVGGLARRRRPGPVRRRRRRAGPARRAAAPRQPRRARAGPAAARASAARAHVPALRRRRLRRPVDARPRDGLAAHLPGTRGRLLDRRPSSFLVAIPSLVAIAAVLGVVAGQRRLPGRPGRSRPGRRTACSACSRRCRPACCSSPSPTGVARHPGLLALRRGRVRLRASPIAPLVAATLADVVPVARPRPDALRGRRADVARRRRLAAGSPAACSTSPPPRPRGLRLGVPAQRRPRPGSAACGCLLVDPDRDSRPPARPAAAPGRRRAR